MSNDKLATLDQFIEEERRLLEGAQKIREIIAAQPRLASLLGILSAPVSSTVACVPTVVSPAVNGTAIVPTEPGGSYGLPACKGGDKAQSAFQTVKDHLLSHDNAWMTIKEIMQVTQRTRGAVTNILYRTHKECFEDKKTKASKDKFWRLSAAALSAVAASNNGGPAAGHCQEIQEV
jgi:hypothetical protein